MGHQGTDTGGAEHGPTQFGQHDFGGQRAGTHAFHVGQGQSQRGGICRVSETLDAPCRATDFSHFGRRSLSSQPASEGLRGQLKREAAIILSAALLPGTQSGRASLELPETPWCGQSWIAQREGTEEVRTGTSSFTATATLDHPHVLSNARHPVCGGLTAIYVYLLMIGLIAKPVAKASVRGLEPFPTWPYFAPDEIEAATAVLRSGKANYWTGEEGHQFEREFANYIGTRSAVCVANGTVALELALCALGIGPGDEVITTSRTFIASASCVVAVGAQPVMADVDRDSQN